MTSLLLGNNVRSIGEKAFEFSSLENVKLPEMLETIGNSAFFNSSLTSISLPDSLDSIGFLAFAGNSPTSITISDGVIIDLYAFAMDNVFKEIYEGIDGGAGTYNFIDGSWVKE